MLSHSVSPRHLKLEVDMDVCAHTTLSPTFPHLEETQRRAITMATKLLHHWSLGKGSCHLGKGWKRSRGKSFPYSNQNPD